MTFDLGFGNSVCVREAFLNTYSGALIVTTHDTLSKFDYPPYTGNPELVKKTKNIIERQTGHRYKHVILTNGATGAINVALRAYSLMGYDTCVTRTAPYYLRYPTMIIQAGLKHIHETDHQIMLKTVALLDCPSNPLNLKGGIAQPGTPTILDGVYLNNVYTNGGITLPKHAVYVGSYSKLTGLNGLRVGFIGVDDDTMYQRLTNQVMAQYCGLATSESLIAEQLLDGMDWETFENKAKFYLDCNRQEFSILEKYIGDTPIQGEGMFYYGPMDAAAQRLFEKAGVVWTKGSTLGTDDGYARFNLAQDRNLISEAVRSVIKCDRSIE